jgi:hypothetical protein
MRLQDVGPFRGHAPQQERPLGGYMILMALFGTATGSFAAWFRRSGREAARGRGLRRALGELLIWPYCLGVWVSATFAAGLLVAPRPTRQALLVLDAVFAADVLQIAYAKGEEAL